MRPKLAILLIIFISLASWTEGQNNAAKPTNNSVQTADKKSSPDTLEAEAKEEVIDSTRLVANQEGVLPSFLPISSFADSSIELVQPQDLGAFFSYYPGINVLRKGGFGQPYEVYSQGMLASASLLKGIPLSDPMTNVSNLYLIDSQKYRLLQIFPISLIEGTNSGGTEINFIPKFFDHTKPYSKIKVFQGSKDYQNINVQLSERIGSYGSFYTTGTQTKTSGFRENSEAIIKNYSVNLRTDVIKDWDFRNFLSMQESNISVPASEDDTSSQPSSLDEKNLQMQTQVAHRINSNIHLFSKTTLKNYRTDSAGVISSQLLNVDQTLKSQFSLLNGKCELGGKFNYYRATGNLSKSEPLYSSALFLRVHKTKTFIPKLNYLVSLNLEREYIPGIHLSPSLLMNYNITDSFSAFLGASYSSQAPSIRELYSLPTTEDSLTAQGNPNLGSESNFSNNLGVEFDSRGYEFRLSYFFRLLDSKILWDDTTAENHIKPRNSGCHNINGLRVKNKLHPFDWLRSSLSLSFIQPQDSSGKRLKNRPGIIFNGRVHFSQQYLDEELGINAIFLERGYADYFSENSYKKPIWVSDLVLSVEYFDVNIFFKVKNAFNRKYEFFQGYPMPPRSIRYGFTWQFLE